MLLSPQASLITEYGRALYCNERALFFASCATPFSKNIDLSSDAILATANPDQDISFDEDIYIQKIIDLYLDSYEMLSNRIKEIAPIHKKLYEDARSQNLITDRDPDASRNSIAIAMRRFFALADNALIFSEQEVKLPVKSIEHYSRIWGGMYNICNLVMDEISFLNGRVYTFHDILNASASQETLRILLTHSDQTLSDTKDEVQRSVLSLELANENFKWAKLAVVAAIALGVAGIVATCIGIRADHYDDNWGQIDKVEINTTEIQNKLVDIKGILSLIQQRNPNFQSSSIDTKLDRIGDRISDIVDAINSQSKSSVIGMVLPEIKEELKAIKGLLESNQRNARQKVDKSIYDALNSIKYLEKKLDNLSEQVSDIKIPPAPQYETRGWGIGRFESKPAQAR